MNKTIEVFTTLKEVEPCLFCSSLSMNKAIYFDNKGVNKPYAFSICFKCQENKENEIFISAMADKNNSIVH